MNDPVLGCLGYLLILTALTLAGFALWGVDLGGTP